MLFLDELPEFDRKVLEVLREPLESGKNRHRPIPRQDPLPRALPIGRRVEPLPRGYLGEPSGRCNCSTEQIQRYRNKLSGPLLKRIDLHLTVAREITDLPPVPQRGDDCHTAAARVAAARDLEQHAKAAPMPFSTCPASTSTASYPQKTSKG